MYFLSLEYMLLVSFKCSVRWIVTENIGFSTDAKEVGLGESIIRLGNKTKIDVSRDLDAIFSLTIC